MAGRSKHQPRGRRADARSLTELRDLLGSQRLRRDRLIEYLHRVQDCFGHIPQRLQVALAHELGLGVAEVHEVASFYQHFDPLHGDDDAPPRYTLRVCDSLACAMAGSEALLNALKTLDISGVRVLPTPCVGRCARPPVAMFGQNPIEQATVDRVVRVIESGDDRPEPLQPSIDYGDYRNGGGYRLLERLHQGELSGDAVVDALRASGLRGLGGAGFPSVLKWEALMRQPPPHYLVVNIDEGEPGTFKDRHFLESDPHRFLEGALIAAHVTGCDKIFLYLRDEYAACRRMLEQELKRLQEDPPVQGLLPLIELRRGAGAYVCGEESALLESLEGKRGMPRQRPPYVTESGLFGHPTLVHNLETLHWIRDAVEACLDSEGKTRPTGLRSYSVSGRVRRPGVYRAPAGISVRELIDDYCGGMQPGHEFYGYFPGGASGGMLPARLGHLPLDFGTLEEYGCFVGSAAVIVFSHRDRAKDLALNALRFFEHESCGQCTPCRVGTAKAVDMMAREHWDFEALEDLCQVMADASICGLGQAAANPIRCLLEHFADELEGDDG